MTNNWLSGKFGIQRGIRQGCPTSGTVWALIFDAVILGLHALADARNGVLRAFADELAAVVRKSDLTPHPGVDSID